MIKLWEDSIPGYDSGISQEVPSVTPYLLDSGRPTPAVIVFPGGGYAMKAEHEGKPIALWLNSIGVSAFVLDYRVAPYRHPYPSIDAKRAVRLVRYNAAKYGIDPDRVGVLGFSAGGHLAATVGTYFEEDGLIEGDPIDACSSRPDAMILCYPVIDFTGEYREDNSMKNLLGENPDENLRYRLSCQNSVTKDTPPAFIWHTANDEGVRVENSLMFAAALSDKKVPFEFHVFPNGRHGLGLASDIPQVRDWTKLCEKWLRSIGF